MEFLFGAVIIILEIVALIDVIRGGLPGPKKVLWAILVLFIPVLGLILYFLVGRPEQTQSAREVTRT